MTIPNFISIFRLFLVPLTIWFMLIGQMKWALLFFLVAGISDALDGYLARKLNQISELGTYLDPIADKALLVSSFVVLSYLGFLPLWLAILVVSRDILIVAGVLLAFVMDRPVEMQPIMVSKINTAAQIITVLMVLVLSAFPELIALDVQSLLVIAAAFGVACFTTVSAVAYMIEWLRHISK